MGKKYAFIFLIPLLWLVLDSCLTMRTGDKSAVANFQKKGIVLTPHVMHINGRVLHYVSTGNDSMPMMMFVHGSPGSWSAFKRYMEDPVLQAKFRLIGVDRPGFGYSDYGRALCLWQNCEIISSLLDSISQGKPVYLVGHSLGGSIVPLIAANRPQLVAAIVLLAGALDPDLEPKEAWRHAFTKVPLRYLLPGAIRPSNDEEWNFKEQVINLRDKLALISCRVYIMHAQNDGIVDVGNLAYMKRTFVNASQISDTIFPTGGHFIPWNHYDYVLKILQKL